MTITDPIAYKEFISKGSAHPDLKAPLVLPDPAMLVSGPTTILSRINCISAWELENPGKELPEDLYWGPYNQYFVLDGVINYYKTTIQNQINDDIQNIQDDNKNADFINFLNLAQSIVPDFNHSRQTLNLNDIKYLINLNPSGMPIFINETPNFYCFQDVGTMKITADNITKDILNKVKKSFNSEWTISSFDPAVALYLQDNNVYWTNLATWCNISNPSLRAGITLIGDNYSFYPFEPLDIKTQQLVELVGARYAKDYNKPFTIVNL